MHIHERIKKVEKAIIEYYTKQDNIQFGRTVLQNIKTKVDYILDRPSYDEWNVEYFKQLCDKSDELKIKRPK
jgi:hypothetical protein